MEIKNYNEYINKNKDFYFEIKDKFPVVKDGVYIHQMPDLNYIHGKNTKEKTRFVFETRTMTTINSDGLILLELCDGRKTTNEIIDNICEIYNCIPKNAAQFIIDFLYTSTRLFNYIKFIEDKLDKAICIEKTGSKYHVIPQHYALELTSRCNLKCKHCYRSCTSNIEEKEISYEVVMKLLKEMYSVGARYIEITGGEAFLHPNIKEILTYVCENYNFVAILTNGTLLTSEMIDYLDMYKDKIIWSISLDSYREDFHDEFRGLRGAYKKTVSAIKQLAKRGHTVRVAMSITDGNLYDIEKTINLVRNKLNGTFFGYSYVMPYGRGKDIEAVISEEEKSRRVAEIDKYTDREELRGYINKIDKEKVKSMKDDMINCGAGWRTVAIGPDGTVRPCIIMEENIVNIGNVNEDSIVNIMNQELVNKLHSLPWPVDGECTSCPNELFCKWCSYRAFTINKERINQGLGLCRWANKNNLNEVIDFNSIDEDKFNMCLTACSMCECE